MTTVNWYIDNNTGTNTWNDYDYTKFYTNNSIVGWAYGSGLYAEFGFVDALPTGAICTQIITHMYAWSNLGGNGIYVTNRINGGLLSEQMHLLNTYETLETTIKNGSWSKTDMDTMTVRLRSAAVAGEYVYVDYVYCVLTYTLPPAAPTSVDTSESPCEDGQSTITWTKSSGATKYRIYEDAASGGSYHAIGSELGDVSSGPTDVETVAQTLYYKVKAGNVAGWSALSATYATVVFIFGYDKVINGVSGLDAINGVAKGDITAWNGVS